MPLPLDRALKLANLIGWSYEIFAHPQIAPSAGVSYRSEAILSVDDIADDGLAFKDDVPFGLLASSTQSGDQDSLVVALRGTNNGLEWFKNLEMGAVSWAKHQGYDVEKVSSTYTTHLASGEAAQTIPFLRR